MGCCFSNSSSANYIQEPIMKTSKIVCMDSSLIEFSIPVTASTILCNDSSSFICNPERLNYDEYILALREDEFVIPGKMYFVLPIEMVKQPVTGGDMAAFAVKAASALSKTVTVRRGNNQIMPLLEDDYRKVVEKVNNIGMSSSLKLRDGMKMKRRGRGIAKVQLSAILEETD